LQDRPHDVLVEPQQHAVGRGAGHVAHRLLGEDRGVAEHLALADEVLQPSAGEQLDPALHDDVGVPRRLPGTRIEDGLARRGAADLGACCDASELLRIEQVERRRRAQE
jgi:hypothetical protein